MVRLLWFTLYALDGVVTAWITKRIVDETLWPGWLVISNIPICCVWVWLAPSEKDTLGFAFLATDVGANLGALLALAVMGQRLQPLAILGAVLALVGIALMAR